MTVGGGRPGVQQKTFDLVFFACIAAAALALGWLTPGEVTDKLQIELLLGIDVSLAMFFARLPGFGTMDAWTCCLIIAGGVATATLGIWDDPYWWSVVVALTKGDPAAAERILDANRYGGFFFLLGIDGTLIGLMLLLRVGLGRFVVKTASTDG